MSLAQKNPGIDGEGRSHTNGACGRVSVLSLSSFQQVATQATAKTRASQFGVSNFQTPSSFSPMSLPGASTASPGAAAYPSLASRGSSFGELGLEGGHLENRTTKERGFGRLLN